MLAAAAPASISSRDGIRASSTCSVEAVDYRMNMSRQNRQLDTEQIFNERKRYAGGLSSHPLIGSPETIVE
jgi:dimethylsulfone monooxygenase